MDKDYIKTVNSWLKEQENIIEQMHTDLNYLGKDVELKNQQISIIKERIIHECNQLYKVKNDLNEYVQSKEEN